MLIQTTRFGEIECKDEELLTFTNGIPGFKEYLKYFLIVIDDSPFIYLQSVEEKSLAFIVVSPFDFFPDYEFELPELVEQEMDVKRTTDIKILNIISVNGDLTTATLNLAAPLIINLANRTGMQYIISDEKYSIRQPLFADSLIVEGSR
ncbi:flagellar assembly protein FliW [Paenibacillus algorifonticola]|uniref:flagellar assembly protein FliW n=1 Tax=Paenibacillus algorifonticola TaxID=684063 RepID=UPI003D26B938